MSLIHYHYGNHSSIPQNLPLVVYGRERKTEDLLPNSRSKKARRLYPIQRKHALKQLANELEALIAPGIKPIKQVKLYTKWRKIVPADKKDIMCPRPSEEKNDKKWKKKQIRIIIVL